VKKQKHTHGYGIFGGGDTSEDARAEKSKGAVLNVDVLVVDFWKVDSLSTLISESRGQAQSCSGLFDPFE